MHAIPRSVSWSLIVVSWLAGACTAGPGTGSGGSSGGSTGGASSTGGSSGGTEGTASGSSGSSGATPTSGGSTSGGSTSGGTEASSGGTEASSGTEATTGGVSRCEAAVGVTECAVLVKLAEELTEELCTTCQGAACGTEPDCDSQFPCVEGRIVVQGCCSDEDCAGLSPFCGMFIAINNVCVVSDDV